MPRRGRRMARTCARAIYYAINKLVVRLYRYVRGLAWLAAAVVAFGARSAGEASVGARSRQIETAVEKN